MGTQPASRIVQCVRPTLLVSRVPLRNAGDLALVRPVLVATRNIEMNEEIFYSYGSDKPFEHIRKQL